VFVMSATVWAMLEAERFAAHANKLALATARRVGRANINYEAEVRREFLWLKRKLAEMEPLFAEDGARAAWHEAHP
jgi:hypothetical protein